MTVLTPPTNTADLVSSNKQMLSNAHYLFFSRTFQRSLAGAQNPVHVRKFIFVGVRYTGF